MMIRSMKDSNLNKISAAKQRETKIKDTHTEYPALHPTGVELLIQFRNFQEQGLR